MNRTSRNLNIIGLILIALQLISYLGNAGKEKINPGVNDTAYNAGYLFGSNIFLITGIILFIIAFFKKRKNNRKKIDALIDSIGKNE